MVQLCNVLFLKKESQPIQTQGEKTQALSEAVIYETILCPDFKAITSPWGCTFWVAFSFNVIPNLW